jgi:hypothetical protein
MADDPSEWPDDPTYDWPSVFRGGDLVRLDDGRLAVVLCIMNYAPEPPYRWQLNVRTTNSGGGPDDLIADPRDCRPDPAGEDEARALGLL